MLSYMDYIRQAFFISTQWNNDNSYASVVDSSSNFDVPDKAALQISAKASNHSFTSYTLSNLGLINGSVSYLYSSQELADIDSSNAIPLHQVVTGYKLLKPLVDKDLGLYQEKWLNGKRVDTFSKSHLLYGRLFLPSNSLEAMLIKQLSSKSQLLVTCVSDSSVKYGGALTANYQRDSGSWCQEFIFSTYEALLGYRGMYSLSFAEIRSASKAAVPVPSKLSLGFELFYGVANKSPGFSTALRYVTQSTYTGSPLTLTLMSNPLMGHLSATYAVQTATNASFASKFDFNLFSYDSDLSLGCEIWRNDSPNSPAPPSVIKSSLHLGSQRLNLLWESKFKDFLASAGVVLSFAERTPRAAGFGLEIQYSS